jgi:hypothetical protein
MASWPPIRGRSLYACERASVLLSCARPPRLMSADTPTYSRRPLLHPKARIPGGISLESFAKEWPSTDAAQRTNPVAEKTVVPPENHIRA